MKAAFVTDCFLPSFGGIESHIYYLAKAMQAEGIEVHIVTHYSKTDSGHTILEREEHGFKVKRIPGRIIYRFGADIYADLSGYSRLKDLFRREDYDIVHCHTLLSLLVYSAAAAAKSLNMPVIVTKHSLNYRAGILNPFITRYLNIFREATAMFDGIIGVSKSVLDEIEVTKCGGEVIHSGVIMNVTPKSAYEDARAELEDGRHELTIGTVCRLVRMKGIYEFADIVMNLKERGINARGVIVGDGPERKNLERYLAGKGLSEDVILTGRKDHSVIDAYFSRFDLFVLASKTEGLGIVLLEAMMNGIPPVSLDSGGPSDIIINGVNGYIEKDVDSISSRIEKVWNDKELMQKLRIDAKKTAEEFTWERTASKTKDFYIKIIRKHR